MHYISRGRKPPKQSFLSGTFDENLRFIGSKWQLAQLLVLAFGAACFVYVFIFALLMLVG